MRHGILLIDKPVGMTSHDVVEAVRRELHEPAVGHLGTLDPAATGLLVLFVGRKALKVIELFHATDKEYEAKILFGKVSSTYDVEGVMEDVPVKPGWEPPSAANLLEVLNTSFRGRIMQRPPIYSAVHVLGKRAYEIARNNQNVLLPEREIVISALQLISYGYPHCKLRISCSSGTYIRSIAHDLGQLLRCGAYLEGLRRTRVRRWSVEDACNVQSTNVQCPMSKQCPNPNDQKMSWKNVIPLKEVLTVFPRIDLTETQWIDVQHGRIIAADVIKEPFIAWYEELPVAVMEQKNGMAHPRKVL